MTKEAKGKKTASKSKAVNRSESAKPRRSSRKTNDIASPVNGLVNESEAPQPYIETDKEVLIEQLGLTQEELSRLVRMYEAAWDDPDDSEWSVVDYVSNSATYHQDILNYRKLAKGISYAKRALNLAEYYITTAHGPEAKLELRNSKDVMSELGENDPVVEAADQAWDLWFEDNPWFSHGECIRRKWRDGEGNLWYNPENGKIRFVDSESIRDINGSFEDAVVTDELDVLEVQQYILTRVNNDPSSIGNQSFIEYARVPEPYFLQMKGEVDSNEKRGLSKLSIAYRLLQRLDRMIETEVRLRISQAQITKVIETMGGSNAVRKMLDATRTSNSTATDNISQQTRARPGTEMVVSQGTKVTYSHPDNNFSNANPLIALLIKAIAAGTGWSYAQLSCDTSEGNLASSTIGEGPVAEMIRKERCEYGRHIKRLYKWILELYGVDVDWGKYEICLEFPELQSMEPLKQAQIVTAGIMNETMSRATGRVRQGLDPDWEEAQIKKEKESGLYNGGFNNQMGGVDNAQQSAAQNAAAAGANQGQPGA